MRTDALDRLLDEFEYEWLQSAEGRDLKCAALFLLILHALRYGGELSGPNRHVEKIKRHIVENFAQPLRVRELAELAGLNAVYCGALFRGWRGSPSPNIPPVARGAAAALLATGLRRDGGGGALRHSAMFTTSAHVQKADRAIAETYGREGSNPSGFAPASAVK